MPYMVVIAVSSEIHPKHIITLIGWTECRISGRSTCRYTQKPLGFRVLSYATLRYVTYIFFILPPFFFFVKLKFYSILSKSYIGGKKTITSIQDSPVIILTLLAA